MAKEMIEKPRDEGELEELEMLLDEIPHATSHNLLHSHHHNHHHCHHPHDHHHHATKQQPHYGNTNANANANANAVYCDDDPLPQIKFSCASSSPASGFSLQSEGSSSSLFSSSPPPFEDLKSTLHSRRFHYPNNNNNNSFCFGCSKIPDSTDQRLVHELGLCANFTKMHIARNNTNDNSNRHDNPSAIPFRDRVNNVHNARRGGGVGGECNDFKRGFSDSMGFQFPEATTTSPVVTQAFSGLSHDYYKMANLVGSQRLSPLNGGGSMDFPRSQLNGLMDSPRSQLSGFGGSSMDSSRSQMNGLGGGGGSMNSPRRRRYLMNDYYCRGGVAPEVVASLSRSPATVDAASLYEQKYGISLLEERGMVSRLPNNNNLRSCASVQELLRYGLSLPNAARRSNTRIPQGNLDSIASEGSFIIQGEGLNYVVSRGSDHSRCQRAGCESGFVKQLLHRRFELDIQHQVAGYENPRSSMNGCSFPLLPKYNSLVEAEGSIYLIAKDQHGCRFLQRMFDEGTREDVQVIFNEIIDHVVELMINPFGNYLMQKLLDVCDEEQRMQIILLVTQEPGQLVRISLNTHGTRVVQKLIETLKTRQQISLVVSALEPGFLALIKDLNGNHVVQHCLQCLRNEDNKFIFVAAAKYCVDIATHQHGCCVLQRCIGHSSGEYREELVAEISNNALLLAQDQYGNYVVQFILDLRIPSATATLSSQFLGKYVYLSMQKFSSHVVEKCLALFNNENRSRVIHELLSTPHFEQLLQDPHANYVVQSALRHSEGHVHNLLVEAIEAHKAISRNSPYSKKIFSQKLLRK
ncbi:hypothetical protein Fmac_010046 [Flemingia macrophylla]|uniref:PUM-HD domain-containing protein n=1 Tax=Flemingia macrophylla TaxID=520843 RepID=A0ABD1N2K0_9FABA